MTQQGFLKINLVGDVWGGLGLWGITKSSHQLEDKARSLGQTYPGVHKSEMHFEERINTPAEQLNKENKEKVR